MEKRKLKKNKAMQNKVTMSEFASVHIKIIKELYETYPMKTIGIILLSCLNITANFVELKLVEYVTNNVARYINGNVGKISLFVIVVALFLLVLLVLCLLSNLNNKIRERYQEAIAFQSELKLINKLSKISYEYYESSQLYEKINLAKGACNQYGNAVYSVTEIVRIVLMLVVYAFMLAKLNVLFIVAVFVALMLSSVFAAGVTDKQLDFWRVHVSPESRRNYYFRGIFSDRIQHAAIQTGRTQYYFGDKYRHYNNLERKNYLKLNIFSFLSELVTSLLFIIIFGVTALVVGNGVAVGKYDIGYYSMVIALIINFFQNIKTFSMFIMNDNHYIRVLEAYYNVLDLDEYECQYINAVDNKIIFHKLYYRYPQATSYALKGLDISFSRGQKIALVGLNGSGKTTLISVILNLLKQYEGICAVDNCIVTAVLQDFGQYQMSIKENIEIGCGGEFLPDEEVWNILYKVGLYDFVKSQSEGIHTNLGQLENGVELSKGQWQRLAIGRLLANRQANVWILDEPTAYLDPSAEIEMYRLILQLSAERLVFFISHRLGFAKMADRIVVIDNGKIVEDGHHTELIHKKDGVYSSMFKMQKEWYI